MYRVVFYIPIIIYINFFLICCGIEKPLITAIDPKIGTQGQRLTIMGENFGKERGESFVLIGGVIPTQSSYFEWTDNKIVLRVPDFGESGLIYVNRNNHKSNPVLFSTQAAMPAVSLKKSNNSLFVSSVNPSAASVGQLITVNGGGFNNLSEGSGVYFSWGVETHGFPITETGVPMIKAENHWAVYEAWDEREIRLRVPDGASSGIIEVRTPLGKSNSIPFEVSYKNNSKIIKNKKTYSLFYSVDINIEKSSPSGSLYVWLPRPVTTAYQLNKEVLNLNIQPFINDYRGTSLFRFLNLETKANRQIAASYLVDVYEIETKITADTVRQNNLSLIDKTLVLPSALIPSGKKEIIDWAKQVTGREQNPFINARSLYRAMLKDISITSTLKQGGALDAMNLKSADPYMAALLYCALCRAAGIPAIPVSGVLVDKRQQTVNHYWVMFWIDNYGWVPVDTALGAGAVNTQFNLIENPADYYFGNLDNQHIAFSFGETGLSQMDVRGRTISMDRSYALQNIWEESLGGLESYSTHWSDINITGVYSN
ncbi:hypothetical protein FACS1894190_08010 [Spirochaetia bacterium]|nr:hypothetical protein FACS1894190_08010 [Spirochaetia bacterium]